MMMDPKEDLCLRLLLNCRNELYHSYPFLDGAFASLPGKPSGDTGSLGTDGKNLLFSGDFLLRLYGEAPERLRRGYLHILLHCLYQHPFRRRGRDRALWNLSCDLAVEQILEREENPRLVIPSNPIRSRCLSVLGETPLAAEAIYDLVKSESFPFSVPAMAAAFLFDDHLLWERAGREEQEHWARVLSYVSRNRRNGKKAGTTAGTARETLEELSRGTQDYRKYLRKFAVSREEMELDMDSFDYIYYHLGMERYGNLPLLEPLETREGHKLSQLVIAIDTSGSCDKETVRNFLRETYSILSDRENFFRKMEVYLLQCDCMVQSAVVIHSREEWENYSRAITIEGRGGTDFTPVFRYVDDLRNQGKLRELKALLYFTDGDGCYPREKPSYETGFVFLKPGEHMHAVPSWAKKLLIEDGMGL